MDSIDLSFPRTDHIVANILRVVLVSLLSVPCSSKHDANSLKKFNFGPYKPFEVEALENTSQVWKSVEAIGVWNKSLNRSGTIRLVQRLLRLNETVRILDVIRNLSKTSLEATTLDSVDGRPQYQMSIHRDNTEIGNMLQTIIQERLLPYVRNHYGCSGCVVCDLVARRYLPDERQKLRLHFDEDAFATAVASLSPPTGHVGGLYIQTDWHVNSRRYLALEEGDAVVHQFDLNHGVDVRSGSRYSLIFWVKDGEKSCLDGSSPWYKSMAETGDVDAQYNLGTRMLTREDFKGAKKWLTRAAKQGHAVAQFNLGGMYLKGKGVGKKVALGREWITKAAEIGYAPIQLKLASAYAQGDGFPKDPDLAAHWMQRAAEQGYFDGLQSLSASFEQQNFASAFEL